LIYLISAVLAPIIGFAIDRIGRNVSFVFFSVLITLFGHSILGFTHLNPYFGIVPMGLGYSLLASALWPIVSLIVPLHRQGTAFGESWTSWANLLKYLIAY
jgi:MFS family permease